MKILSCSTFNKNYRNSVLALLFSLFSLIAFSQETFTISGKVTDVEGDPISGVSVLIKDTSNSAQTNLNGDYLIRLESGPVTLVFSSQFTFKAERSFDLISDLVYDMVLDKKPEILDQVLVKAVRVNASSPITHSNLEKEEIEERNLGQDIPVLMNYMPSVVTTSDAGAGIGYTGIRIRGINAQSTNVTINGIPYNDAESMGTFWVNLGDFASSVESLQLQRGVGTSTNGSGAFGASINILTDAVRDSSYAEINNSFGSYSTRKHTIKIGSGLLNERFELTGRLSQIVSDGYIDRASSNLRSYFVQGTYTYNNTLIKAIVFGGNEVTYQSWYGFEPAVVGAIGFNSNIKENRTFNIAGIQFDDDGNFQGYYDNQVDDYSQDHYQLHFSQRLGSGWTANLGLNYTYGRGFFEEYVDDYLYQNIYFSGDSTFDFLGLEPFIQNGEEINSTDYARRRWLANDFYVLNANINYSKNGLNVLGGASYNIYKGEHFGEILWARNAPSIETGDRYYFGLGKKKDFNLFSKATWRVSDRVQLYGDLQMRQIDYNTKGQASDKSDLIIDKSYTFFNPKAGITYSLGDLDDLYFSYARANREPNRDDFQNNPKVNPEQLNDFELGWRHNGENLKINSNLYYMHYNEQLVLTGRLDDVGNPIRDNSGVSYRFGIELEAAFRLFPNVLIQPNITLSSNKNIETIASIDGEIVDLGKTDISFSPEIVAANRIEFRPTLNLSLSLLSKYVGEQYMSNIESEFSKLNSYFINDLNLSYELKTNSFIDSMVFTALVNNIFNVDYISNGYYYSFDDDFSQPGMVTTVEGVGFYPQATTNFLAGVTLKF